jgi:hypothetical protein
MLRPPDGTSGNHLAHCTRCQIGNVVHAADTRGQTFSSGQGMIGSRLVNDPGFWAWLI